MEYVDENGKEFLLSQDDCATCKRVIKSGCVGDRGRFVRLFEKGSNKPWGEIVVNCDKYVGKRNS